MAVATATAFTLAASTTSAAAQPGPVRHASRLGAPMDAPAPSVPATNRGADQMALWENLPVAEWDESLEEDCVENGGVACSMSKKQIDSVLPDIERVTAELDKEIRDKPELLAPLHPAGSGSGSVAGPRVRALDPSKMVAAVKNVAANASSPAVREFGARFADRVEQVTEHVSNADVAHDGLTASNLEGLAKTVLYATPYLGDPFSLAEAVANHDLEGSVVAMVSLTGAMVATVFPPAGVAIAAAVLVYGLAKKIWGWLCGKSRDWRLNPPGDPRELWNNGADIRWESQVLPKQPGETKPGPAFAVPMTVMPTEAREDYQWAHTKLVLDSRWSDAAKQGKDPVSYTLRGIDMYGLQFTQGPIRFRGFQDGKRFDATCYYLDKAGRDEQHLGNSWTDGDAMNCNLNKPLVISKGHSAVVLIDYAYLLTTAQPDWFKKQFANWLCTPAPCVPANTAKFTSVVRVTSDATLFRMPTQFNFGYVPDYPGSRVDNVVDAPM
ncbi:hypothetical protein GCM10009839_18400 [Catenulispora yoronensis]|uniref:Uncharacterized protein n=2 Tax=Catenulispora yoronensis TaxID=450799 RepID=A0ABN2TUX5_9ACTN